MQIRRFGRWTLGFGIAVAAACGSPAVSTVTSPSPHSPHGSAGAGPSCTGTDALVADPAAPHGLFVLTTGGRGTTQDAITRYLLPNPDICGADWWIRWNQVDRGPQANPRYDWTEVESEIAPWEAANKEINLIVIGAAEGASPTQGATPAYVMGQVSAVTCGGQSQPTPVFWQAGYENNWHAFITQAVGHFSADAHVGYLRFGIGTGGEGLVGPAADKPGPCKQQWDAAGYQTQWVPYNQRLIAFEASLHSKHQLMIGLNQFDNANTLAEANAAQAAAAGIGFGQQGLKARDVTDITSNAVCVPGDWCHLFQRYAGTVPLEVQQLAVSNPSGAPATPGVTGTGPGSAESVATGPIPPLLTAALSVHAQIFEVYAEDLLLAFDGDWPGYQKYGAEYASAYDALAKVVGSAG